MLKTIKYGLILLMLSFPTGCVDLFYAKDFTYQEFVRDHIKEPFGSLSDLYKKEQQDRAGESALEDNNS